MRTRFEVAADPARLDVGDLARTELDRVGGAGPPTRATRRGRPACRPPRPARAWPMMSSSGSGCSMSSRSKSSSRREVRAVGAAVGRVGVDLERRVGPDQFAHGGDLLDVGAGLDLQLDPHVAVVEVALARRRAARRCVSWMPTLTPLGMRSPWRRGTSANDWPVGPQLGVEDRHLERRLGHRMPVELGRARGATSAASSVGRRRPGGAGGGGSSRAAAPSTYSGE